ncbi:putative exonuclease [Hypoxylon sp. FL0890]|nr:putative exonuclease [Hypoxylon sp. FL0890]
MGIQGLLPLLKSIQRPVELKKYNGETLGVDAYGWLHRGAVPCAIDLAQGKPTRKYVDFAMSRVRMLRHFGITPYLVFDGGFLPSKATTEASRAKRREECRKAGLELLKAGKPSQAHAELQKAIDVTPEMARHLIEELKKAGVPYVVAPYEADPQLVYLERQGLISGILSEDSDLLVFGAKRLLTKLDQHGQCIEINRRDFCACREVSLTGWTDAQFRQMAILSGCDYLDSITNLGLKTAHRMMRKHKTPERVVRMLQFDGKYRVPADYLTMFHQAEKTFLYQWVFCPKANELVHFTEPGPNIKVDELPFIGPFIEPEVARGIATGDMNPITKQRIVLQMGPSPRKRTASGTSIAIAGQARAPASKPIDSYLKGHRRIPLGEMEPNCFAVDPARVSAITENGNRPIVYPLPRPYIENTRFTSTISRSYINRSEASSRALRRRTDPNALRSVDNSLAPSSRRQTTGPEMDIIRNSDTNVLSNRAQSFASNSRRQSIGLGVDIERNSETARATNPARPSKKARLCDDASSGLSLGKEKSKFFSPSNVKDVATKKGKGYLMSDDSIEETLRHLPEFDGWGVSTKDKKDVIVYEEANASSATTETSKDDEVYSKDNIVETTASIQDNEPSHDPNITERFAYTPTASSSLPAYTHGYSGTQSVASASSRSSLPGLTPASSIASSARPSTAKTPATPRMTPLQRLGVRALGRNKEPPTPSFTAPRFQKRSSRERPSLNSFPVNPAFVALPPVDLEEVEALHQPVGSEDLMYPGDEDDEALDGQENVGLGKDKKERKKPDLSRFLFA